MTTHPEPMHPELVTRILHLPMTSDAHAFHMTAAASERIIVDISVPSPAQRGRLEEYVVSAIDAELDARGAAPSGCSAGEPLAAKLDDQLYRARLLGAGGLALRFHALEGIADGQGGLCAEDSATLHRLFDVAEHERLQLFLPQASSALRVLGTPHQLSDLVPVAPRNGHVALIEHEPIDRAGDVLDASPPSAPRAANATAEVDLFEPAIEAFVSDRVAPCGEEHAPGTTAERPEGAAGHSPGSDGRSAARRDEPQGPDGSVVRELPAGLAWSEARAQRCAAWAAQLRGMSGPKGHGSVEKAFATAYLPLRREVAAGNTPEDVRAAVETWAEGFAQSYASAFKSLASRTKRPRMVRDVIELGIAWLNQSKARQCQLLMIDAMRFDLGQLLNERLERELAGAAECLDQVLLWAALPSNAESQQLGVQRAARRAGSERRGDEPPEDAGRIVSLRAGTRELYRLDHIGKDLVQPGEVEAARLERLADSLARVVVPWMRAQPPDTLVIVFGDHGFHWQVSPSGTGSARRGGALPEQVLTSASGWLVGQRRRESRAAPGLH